MYGSTKTNIYFDIYANKIILKGCYKGSKKASMHNAKSKSTVDKLFFVYSQYFCK